MTLVILTPDNADAEYVKRWSLRFDRLAAPLRAAGFEVESRTWTDPGDLNRAQAVLPLLTWGYHKLPDQWDALLATLGQLKIPVLNAPDVLRWNTDKIYLQQLEAQGAPTVPTVFADRLDAAALQAARERFGAVELVAKPRVSAGAFRTLRIAPRADVPDDAPQGPVMVQPFLPAVNGEGEFSLLYFNGRFSHALSKVAKAGDFRVQPQYDSLVADHAPDVDMLATAEAVLAAAGRGFTYARIDLIRDESGALRLMELEAIEPDLYLEHAADGGAAFAAAVRAAVG